MGKCVKFACYSSQRLNGLQVSSRLGVLVCAPGDTCNCNRYIYFYRAYNVVFGLLQAPYYAFSQTMMAELTPPGFENMVRVSLAELTSLLMTKILVLRYFWTVDASVIDDRTECDTSDH